MEIFNYRLDKQGNENLKELQLVRRFKAHNVIKERVELYRDFITNLLYYIDDTYLGTEYIKNDYDIEGHFNWAYNKVLIEFLDQDIDFTTNENLREYLFRYFKNEYYDSQKKFSFHKRFWDEVFEVNKKDKKKSVFELLLEVYEIFDESLGNKKHEPELLY
jgi:hypothetical protein